MRYTFRQLEVFLACAQFENMTKAADSLAMSQSAASSALKELEHQFSTQLFDRVGKRLQINDTGLAVRPLVHSLLSQAAELEQSLMQQPGGVLKVGATLTIGNYLAVPIMAEFMERYPCSHIDLDVANTSSIANKLQHFELDVGLLEGEVNHPDLEINRWCEDELVVFVSPEHALAKRQPVSNQDLVDAQWILREPGSGTRQHFDKAMSGLLSSLNIRIELQHTEAIKRAVAANLGVGCLSKMTLLDDFERGDFVQLQVDGHDFTRQFYFAWHRQKYQSQTMNRWLDLCRELIVLP